VNPRVKALMCALLLVASLSLVPTTPAEGQHVGSGKTSYAHLERGTSPLRP